MGAAGRERARQSYDWAVIYRRYQTLWEDLAERRRADPDLHPPLSSTARPNRPDPFAAFAGYATTQLSDQHLVTLQDGANLVETHRALALNSFAGAVQPTVEECARIVEFLRTNGPQSAAAVAGQFPLEQRVRIARGLVWMAKMEAVRIDPPGKAGAI
jgi:hypothetical protein